MGPRRVRVRPWAQPAHPRLCFPGRKASVDTFLETLQHHIDALPSHTKRTARDYLAEDRLTRRIRHGEQSFAGELRGYQDRYHPAAAVDKQGLSPTCTCDRRQPCGHVSALLIDIERHILSYPEVPWDVVRQWVLDTVWQWDAAFAWQLVPDATPEWRMPYRPELGASVLAQVRSADYVPLARDPRVGIWAEAHSSWWEVPEFLQGFSRWASGARLSSADPRLCAALIWMQPALPMARLIDAGLMHRIALAAPLLGWLFHPRPVLASSSARQLRALESLTLAVPDGSENFLWDAFPDVDPDHLARADALYLAGHPQHAIRLLEQHLPTESLARRAARQRLVDWMNLDAGIPHRTALALETGQLDFVLPVRHLIGDSEWRSLEAAVRSRAGDGGEEPDRV